MKLIKKKNKELMEAVTFSITPSQHQKLYDISEKEGVSVSKFVRNWIDSLNEKPKKKKIKANLAYSFV